MARKVLLADDSVTAQNMGRKILMDAGYEVTTVNNGSAALKKIAELKPDLVILDVYMPGYGGLEVCQRVRESQETARIPVLLSVGKLEPFKADEARRVQADAFIVKPFEAGELLTALTKLEEKIVPPPQRNKPSRFPKPGVPVEASFSDPQEFGDPQKGWKNRLKIPPPHSKARGAESAAAAEQASEVSSATQKSQASQAGSGPEGKLSLATTPDITAEQCAALQAATTAFDVQTPGVGAPSRSADESSAIVAKDSVDNKEEGSPTISSETNVEPASFAPTPECQPEGEKISVAEQPKPSDDQQAAKPEEISKDAAAGAQAIGSAANSGQLAEDEVAAALESLPKAELIPATIAAAVTDREFSGLRWVAQGAALTEAESSLILEQEMQKAFAALAAADAASTTLSASSNEVVATAAQESSPPQTPAVCPPAEAPATSYQSASEPQEAAYAAAASAASGGPKLESATAAHELGEHRESDLASAWANWKQIRESVASPQFTAQLAEAAVGFKDIRRDQASSQPATETSSALASDESSAIASIVDSVLAELKPKLMEEIAKKMGKDKK